MSASNLRNRSGYKRRIFLVDDHASVREGFVEIISAQSDLEVCGEADSASPAVEAVGRLKPDMVVVDLSLQGGSGLELIKDLKALHPDLLMLVVSMHDEGLYAERALRAGARGYVMKRENSARLLEAIRCVLDGRICVSSAIRERMLQMSVGSKPKPGSEVERLTDRELEIFQLMGEGSGTRQISKKLHLSISTVETHRTHIKEKLNLKNGTELMRRAVEWVSQR